MFPGAPGASIFSAPPVNSCKRGDAGDSSQSIRCLVPGGEWKQGDIPGLLDGAGQAALVRCANARQTPRHNLASLGHKSLQQTYVAVRDRIDLFRAELAHLLATEELAASTWSTSGTWASRPATGTRS